MADAADATMPQGTPAGTDEVLRVEDLRMRFGDFEALKGVSLSLSRGTLVGLIGPNGCGKSTMMRCISRALDMTSGAVLVDGMDVSSMKPADVAKLVATVPAEVGQTFGTTVMDMVMLGRYPYVDRVWWETEEDERIVREALRTFGLDHLRKKRVALCSSGERQRVLIAKAYVQEPTLMLVDEPTSHLDMKYKLNVMEYLRSLAHKDMTVMVAEHDISLMARYCDTCIIMKEGEIVTMGDPKEVITEDLIRDVYEVEARVGLDVDGEIYVLPKKYAGQEEGRPLPWMREGGRPSATGAATSGPPGRTRLRGGAPVATRPDGTSPRGRPIPASSAGRSSAWGRSTTPAPPAAGGRRSPLRTRSCTATSATTSGGAAQTPRRGGVPCVTPRSGTSPRPSG